jgi:hypothetical protein
MFGLKSKFVVLALVSGTLGASAQVVYAANPPANPYGTAAIAAAGRTIEITAMTKWVNVNNGETVTFIQGGNTFTWHFDTFPAVTNFPLDRITPSSFGNVKARVYVDADPASAG